MGGGHCRKEGSTTLAESNSQSLLSAAVLNDVAIWLRRHTGVDLAPYKQPYIGRRILARMRRVGATGPADYLERLEREPAEAEALLSALTVHVTGFYRNPTTFAFLAREVYPALFERVGRRPLRIWSLGCASGEEPYSVALQLTAGGWGGRFGILATDIAAEVLALARSGRYDETALAAVPAAQRRFFQREAGGWRLVPEVAQTVRFRRQDVLDARPYPRADLILCRNLLIYFDRSRQETILGRLADSLPEGGVLVLGRAESLLGSCWERFHCLSSGERVYRRK